MSKLTPFDIEFFELSTTLKSEVTETSKRQITKTLLKLNNPTYYYKFIKRHPIENYGYKAHSTMNPILLAIANMIQILKTQTSNTQLEKDLQKEISWAFNNYNSYCLVNL
jgi:hypothetical protein